MDAAVVNVSRTGALIRTEHEQRPGAQWPLVLAFSHTDVQITARVVRCELVRAASRKAPPEFALGLVFVNPSDQAQAVLDKVCRIATADSKHARRLSVSFVRRCPECKSRAVYKETKRHYCCNDCGQRFAGIRVGIVRFAR
jgi:adenosine deaminase